MTIIGDESEEVKVDESVEHVVIVSEKVVEEDSEKNMVKEEEDNVMEMLPDAVAVEEVALEAESTEDPETKKESIPVDDAVLVTENAALEAESTADTVNDTNNANTPSDDRVFNTEEAIDEDSEKNMVKEEEDNVMEMLPDAVAVEEVALEAESTEDPETKKESIPVDDAVLVTENAALEAESAMDPVSDTNDANTPSDDRVISTDEEIEGKEEEEEDATLVAESMEYLETSDKNIPVGDALIITEDPVRENKEENESADVAEDVTEEADEVKEKEEETVLEELATETESAMDPVSETNEANAPIDGAVVVTDEDLQEDAEKNMGKEEEEKFKEMSPNAVVVDEVAPEADPTEYIEKKETNKGVVDAVLVTNVASEAESTTDPVRWNKEAIVPSDDPVIFTEEEIDEDAQKDIEKEEEQKLEEIAFVAGPTEDPESTYSNGPTVQGNTLAKTIDANSLKVISDSDKSPVEEFEPRKTPDVVFFDISMENEDIPSDIVSSPSKSSATTNVVNNKSNNPLQTNKFSTHRPIVFAGPSGAGKSTLIKAMMKHFSDDQFGFSVSHTTRNPREGEVNGLHYNFVDESTMKEDIKNGKFIEFAEVHGHYYGTSFAAVESVQGKGQICILDIDIQGVNKLKASSLKPHYVFIAPPSLTELESRLRKRGTESEDSIKQRLTNARKEIEYGMKVGNFDKIIVNDNLGKSTNEIQNLIKKWYPNILESVVPESSSVLSSCAACTIS